MPVPLLLPQTQIVAVTDAVEAALVKNKVIEANETAREVLTSNGMGLEQALTGLSNLALVAKDNVKHAALRDILDIHGVKFRQEQVVDSKPVINININAENPNLTLNQMFAPER